MCKVFKTARCTLSPISKLDYSDIQDLYSDLETRLFLGGVVVSEAFDEKFEGLIGLEDAVNWVVRESSTNEFISLVSLSQHHNKIDMEISYQLISSQFSKGYAVEVLQALIDYSFFELKLKRVLAETQSKNIRSVKLLEKLGFELDSTLVRFGEHQSIYVLHTLV